MTLPATRVLQIKEPARTQAMDLLVEDRVTVALQAHVPKGSNQTELVVSVGKNRAGARKLVKVPVAGSISVPIDQGAYLLGKYGKDSPQRAVTPEGAGLAPAKRSYLVELPLDQNDDISIEVAGDGQLATMGGQPVIRPYVPEPDEDDIEIDGEDDDDAEPLAAPVDGRLRSSDQSPPKQAAKPADLDTELAHLFPDETAPKPEYHEVPDADATPAPTKAATRR